MKRLRSSDSLTPISPTAPHGEEKMYGMAFSSILESMEDDDCGDELCSSSNTSKKRRLSVDQVRSLEKSFEIENKLDPERKVRLAQELNLQPRQVAVWFQNRRARWKTKQLERDYNALKASYEALRVDYDSLRDDNQSLAAEIEELKSKLADEEPSGSPESDEKPFELVEDDNPPLIYKDGSSDSDSSGVLNDDASPPYHPVRDASPPYHPVLPEAQAIFDSATTNAFMDSRPAKGFGFFHQLLKEEEQDDTCTDWFSDEQPPTLSWCCPDSWNWADGGGEVNIPKREGPF